jgi:hypothetical protein
MVKSSKKTQLLKEWDKLYNKLFRDISELSNYTKNDIKELYEVWFECDQLSLTDFNNFLNLKKSK